MRITGGEWRGRALESVASDRLRPTTDKVRQAVFNRLAADLEDTLFVDLFAGTGSVGLEALSRGARSVVWVEEDRKIFQVLRKNVMDLTGDARGLHRQRVETFLAAPPEGQASLVWADPPYDRPPAPLVEALARSSLLAPGGRFILEHSRRVKPPETPGLTLLDTREYGDSAVTFYARPATP